MVPQTERPAGADFACLPAIILTSIGVVGKPVRLAAQRGFQRRAFREEGWDEQFPRILIQSVIAFAEE